MAQLGCEYFGLYKVLWAEIAQSTMGSFSIVLLAPIRDDYSCFAQIQ